MSDWVEGELAEGQRHDVRHTKRLARLFGRLSARPISSIPTACHGWAETGAAYRFLQNSAMGVQEILSGHPHATIERIRAQEVVLLGQDPTFLHDGPTPPTAGRGTVKSKTRDEYLLHPTVAFPPERVHFGVVGMKGWQRPEQPVAPQRKRKPLTEKERYRGLEGSQGACEIKQACPATVVGPMADREGDIQEWLVDVRRREPGQRAAGSMRAQEHRRLAPGAAQRYVGAERQQTWSVGTRTIDLARQPDRPPRPMPLAVTAKPVTCYGARRPGGTLPPVEVRAVEAQAVRPPQGEAPVAWVLLTSRPVTDFPRACTVGQWYRCRWDIAWFFRGLQQGGQIEQGRGQTAPRVRNALASSVIVAWRLHTITMASRAYPEGSCEVLFAPQAWHTLSTMPQHRHPPPTPPPLREMVRSLAQLGGFFARTGDGEPGLKPLWQGDHRLHEFIYAVDTYQTVNGIERSMR